MRTVIVVLMAFAMVFAGCADKKEPSSTDPTDKLGLTATDETGVIRGVVVDAAIRPLEGAVVILILGPDDEKETTSDGDGVFGFDGLQPGTYFVKVTKIGYHKAQASADVIAGVSTPDAIKVLLESDPASIPYFQLHKFTGFIECSVRVRDPAVGTGFYYGSNPCSGFTTPVGGTGPIGNQETQFDVPFDALPSFVQGELAWSSSQTTGSGLSLVMGPPLAEGGTFCADVKWDRMDGVSPLRVRMNETTASSLAEDGAKDGACFRIFAWSAPEAADVFGMAFSQEFELYATAFYNFGPSEEWMFVNDGEPTIPQ